MRRRVAAEHALRAAAGAPLVVTDLHVTYLGFGRVGPVRSRVEVLGRRRRARRRARRARRRGRRAPADDDGQRRRVGDGNAMTTSGSSDRTGATSAATCSPSSTKKTASASPGSRRHPTISATRAAAIRAGALLTMLDNVGGVCGGSPRSPTAGSCRRTSRRGSSRASTRARCASSPTLLRRGRNNVVTSVRRGRRRQSRRVRGRRCAHVGDPRARERSAAVGTPAAHRYRSSRSTTRPTLREWLGARIVDDADHRDRPRRRAAQPVGHPARRRRRDAGRSRGRARNDRRRVADVVLHYLAPNRVGPVRATVAVLGARSDGTVCRVEVRDGGADRVTASRRCVTARA